MSEFSEQAIIEAWQENAEPWCAALASGAIKSREAITNQAIVDAICRLRPRRVLDIGCGEGWLLQALAEQGIAAEGVDVVPELIDAARRRGAQCECLSYEALARRPASPDYDVIVCNFSLLGESLQSLLAALVGRLAPGGRVLVQTLHPVFSRPERYQSAWQAGSWQGLEPALQKQFKSAAPWFFRPLSAWIELFCESGLLIERCVEPSSQPGDPAVSIIFQLLPTP